MIKTKVIATIGPASSTLEKLEALIDAGVDVIRLNFSHGTLDQHGQVVQHVRRLADDRDTAVAIMGDLSGPKIRTGLIDPNNAALRAGDQLTIQKQPITGTNRRISTTFPQLIDEATVGDRILIDDGQVELRVESKSGDQLSCRCIRGGALSNNKGINLPDTGLNIPALTEKDLTDLQWAIDNKLDYLALSFVRHPKDLLDLRQRLSSAKSDINIIAKIEKPQAIEHIDAIIQASDGILVARGDLGVEMELARVPLMQKDITRRCRAAGKPVIIATQMLQSMVSATVPTRAEVSDVANAILDTADAVMLSAETASGQYPLEAVHAMQQICQSTESYQTQFAPPNDGPIEDREYRVTSFIAHGAKRLADSLNPPLVAVWTQSGQSAKLLSKQRFNQPIVALTENSRTLNKLALYYGVIPVTSPCPEDTNDVLKLLDKILLERGWVEANQSIIVIAGIHFKHTGGNNALLIHEVGKV